ncbi:glycosyltransferase [Desulfolithobacter sp.]
MKTVLVWGRADQDYSRNRIVVRLFSGLGWQVRFFRPFSSQLGLLHSLWTRPQRPDLIWVPCFRHDDIGSASFWSRKWQVPLIVDPFISSFAKVVLERRKYPTGSRAAEKLRKRESALLNRADLVFADTHCHADFFVQHLDVQTEKTAVLPVGADEELFSPLGWPEDQEKIDILFYGSFLRLHGIETIIRAAALCRDLPARWTILGDGDLRSGLLQQAAGLSNVAFEPWIPYAELPKRMARAHILLGIFGDTPQAARVIPNKVFQAMASARPVITRTSAAYEGTIGDTEEIGWVEADDHQGLAATVCNLLQDPHRLPEIGHRTRCLYEKYFSQERLQSILARSLDRVLLRD